MDKTKKSYDQICFSVLAYEFRDSEEKDNDNRIKKRLKYYKVGEYDQKRVDLIRALKNDLKQEISKHSKSQYYARSTGQYAALEDFNTDRMIDAYSRKYPNIDISELAGIINFALYVYYLR